MAEECLYVHMCIYPSCESVVEYDDEPWCFKHSPDSGSMIIGYSAEKARLANVDIILCECMFSDGFEHGQTVCNRCHGDFYSCECPVIHKRNCPHFKEELQCP